MPDNLRPSSSFRSLDERIPPDLGLPALRAGRVELERHLHEIGSASLPPLPNPHREPRVTPEARRRAVRAAVLIAVASHETGPRLLLTRRHGAISFGGHVCFPGGRADAEDGSPERTALREAHEEIGLPPASVRLLGRLGDYVTHSGFCIAPIVGWIDELPRLSPAEGEVEEILELPLEHALRPDSYSLRRPAGFESRAYYVLEHGETVVTGPTVSILLGLYRQLWRGAAPG